MADVLEQSFWTVGLQARKSRLRCLVAGAIVTIAVLGAANGKMALSAFSQGLAQAASGHGLEAIGEYLFHSKRLSADNTVSCESCHVPKLGYSGDRPLAVGYLGYQSNRRAPTLLGASNSSALMWDGRALTLETQVVIPLEGPEMRVDWREALRALSEEAGFQERLKAARRSVIDRGIAISALAAYVRTINGGYTRFDKFYGHDDANALTAQEQLGFRLFLRKASCASCHLANAGTTSFTDGGFHVTGVGQTNDKGRGAITGRAEDDRAFKTPTLRSVSLRPFLMHDGGMTSLRQVVEYYNTIDRSKTPGLDPRLKPLLLSDAEIDAIVAFLKTLTPDEAAR